MAVYRKSWMTDRYPRPQMARSAYRLLDTEPWTCNGREIRMPYPPESRNSGYAGDKTDSYRYSVTFSLRMGWHNLNDELIPCPLKRESTQRVLLHFGAVDQMCIVQLNGTYAGKHAGGYLPFTFDVTDLVVDGSNVLEVAATDSLSHVFPYGKQSRKPKGMWYTPVSGVWQSVWLEVVPHDYIADVVLTSDLTGCEIRLNDSMGRPMSDFTVELIDENVPEAGQGSSNQANRDAGKRHFRGAAGRIEPGEVHLWTPQQPWLYRIRISRAGDVVESYFGLRTISVGEDRRGTRRVCLNDRPVFLHGVLDQGYWPDGIFLPDSPECYADDVVRLKKLGFNCLRKHIKVEPGQFYYACDRLGMLVIQDMVNNGPYRALRDTALPNLGRVKKSDVGSSAIGLPDREDEAERRQFFEKHMLDTIRHLYSHPAIVIYTIFNEGWGQFDSDRMYDIAKKCDPTRLYDSTSGWYAQERSDFDSEHHYQAKFTLTPGERPMLLSECGGYTCPVAGHLTANRQHYGYGGVKHSSEELTEAIRRLYETEVIPVIPAGLCGCVYTQLSDVEGEVNGLYTYDRQVCKVNRDVMRQIASKLVISDV